MITPRWSTTQLGSRFSALQRAEIAEMVPRVLLFGVLDWFQCSSTSRNC